MGGAPNHVLPKVSEPYCSGQHYSLDENDLSNISTTTMCGTVGASSHLLPSEQNE